MSPLRPAFGHVVKRVASDAEDRVFPRVEVAGVVQVRGLALLIIRTAALATRTSRIIAAASLEDKRDAAKAS